MAFLFSVRNFCSKLDSSSPPKLTMSEALAPKTISYCFDYLKAFPSSSLNFTSFLGAAFLVTFLESSIINDIINYKR
jgi:hypothetical protein